MVSNRKLVVCTLRSRQLVQAVVMRLRLILSTEAGGDAEAAGIIEKQIVAACVERRGFWTKFFIDWNLKSVDEERVTNARGLEKWAAEHHVTGHLRTFSLPLFPENTFVKEKNDFEIEV